MLRTCLATILCGFIGVLFLGCSGADRPDLVEIEGTVTLDGEPLGDAQIFFLTADPDSPYQRPASGKTNASGKFTSRPTAIQKGFHWEPTKWESSSKKWSESYPRTRMPRRSLNLAYLSK